MEKGNRQLKQILSRRQILVLFRAIGTATLVIGCTPRKTNTAQPQSSVPAQASSTASSTANSTLPTCIVTPEQIEGPYFVDEKLNRSDIRSDPSDNSVKQGIPLQLTLRVSQVNSSGCTPLKDVIVDLWHCDAQGIYSDATDPGFTTVGKKFLRGYQVTDDDGTVQFITIYPGWYEARSAHVHFKVRTSDTSGKSYEFTSQLYFDDSITDQVYARAPYASKGQRKLRNADDMLFSAGGEELLLTLTKTDQAYAATFNIGIQPV